MFVLWLVQRCADITFQYSDSRFPSLDNIRVMVIVWELLCAGLCDTVFTVSSMSSSYRFNRLGLSHWDPYTVHRGSCLELYHCNMVEWFWWDSSLISTTYWFIFQCSDTVGLVIWPVEIVPVMC